VLQEIYAVGHPAAPEAPPSCATAILLPGKAATMRRRCGARNDMKKIVSLSGFLIALLVLATAIEASDNSTVNFGANSNITAHTVCKKVTNGSATGLSVYVPTQTSAEWLSFYTNPPAGVTAGSCESVATLKNAVLPFPIEDMACTTDPVTDKIYCFGGSNITTDARVNTIIEYDPGTDRVTVKNGTLPTARENMSCVTVPSTRKIYCLGGYYGGYIGVPSQQIAEIAEYDILTDTMVVKGSLPRPRNFHSCTYSSANGRIYCFGGRWSSGGFIDMNEVVEYNPTTNVASVKASLYYNYRVGPACIDHPPTGKIYCFAGTYVSGGGSQQPTILTQYDPLTNAVSIRNAVIPRRTEGLGSSSASCEFSAPSGKIYCMSGRMGAYDAVADSFAIIPTTFVSNSGIDSCASTSNGNIYCFGVYNPSATPYTRNRISELVP
jgi:hypothetical protein